MRHPTPEELKPLLMAIDTARWCMAVKEHTLKGVRCKVDYKNALKELWETWDQWQIKMDDKIAVLSNGADRGGV